MTFIICTIHVDGTETHSETCVNDRAEIGAVEKGMTLGGHDVRVRFTFDPPLLTPAALDAGGTAD